MPCQREIEALANAGKRVPRLVEGDVRAAREECAACGGERNAVPRGGTATEPEEAGERGQRDGCEAEMVLRARGMTVVAMPAGWEAGKSVGVCGGGRVSGNEGEGLENGNEAGDCRVIRDGEALMYDQKTYQFRGIIRWKYIRKLVAARGDYVACGKNLKSYFANNKESRAFFEAAVRAEGTGRNGTGRYKLKV
jgi:hypothetical protein